MFYIFIYILIIVIYWLYLNNKINLNVAVGISNIIYLFFVGFAKNIGSDYNQYFNYFKKITSIPKLYLEDSGYGIMIIFYLFKKNISQNYNIFLFFMVFFNLLIFYKLFKRMKLMRLYIPSLIVYFCFFLVNNNLNALKQGIAISLYSFSYIYIYEKKYLKYICCILIGMLFHSTIILFLPTYIFVTRRIKKKVLFKIYILGLVIICILLKYNALIAKLFISNYRYYQYFLKVFGKKINILNIIEVYVPLLIILYYDFKYKLSANKKIRMLINSYCFYSLLYIVCIFDKMIGIRLSLYLSIFFSIGYALIFYISYKIYKNKIIIFIIFNFILFIFLNIRFIRNPYTENYQNILLDLLK